MKILIVGSGGREHALAWALRHEAPRAQLFIAPGNPGLEELGTCIPIQAGEIDKLLAFAAAERVDLTVVGPEAPLAAGIVDRFRQRGLAIFGPTAAAAQLETSKAFAKEVMVAAGVPTARAERHTSLAAAKEGIARFGAPVVIKASGLAAGKGVVVAPTVDDAERAATMMLEEGGMGDAGREVLVEEFMEGEELSLFVITDGERAIPLLPAQDHKRLLEGDRGPNTGGMGAYAPVSLPGLEGDDPADAPLVRDVLASVVAPTLAEMRRRGTPFTGLLYVGLMLTAEGPKVVEFNARFGDPETQAVLPLLQLEPGLLALFGTVARGEHLPAKVRCTARGHAVTTVVASEGYPESPRLGDLLKLPRVEDVGVLVFHAGTARDADGQLHVAGGRVVAVTAVAPSFEEAQALSAKYAARVQFTGRQFRADIGWRELARVARAP
ncbi:MAG TPA: phosphoribosylamine--glycine ligase [Gemmatimonadaceae bacterium]